MSAEHRATDEELERLAMAYLADEHAPDDIVKRVAPLTQGEIIVLTLMVEERRKELAVRESDRTLAEDLREAGLPALAARAEAGEWNDYFGRHDFPQHELIAALREEITLANVARKRLIDNVIAGKYDGTEEESAEWAASPEGQNTFKELRGLDES